MKNNNVSAASPENSVNDANSIQWYDQQLFPAVTNQRKPWCLNGTTLELSIEILKLELHLRAVANGVEVSSHRLVHWWRSTPQNLQTREIRSISARNFYPQETNSAMIDVNPGSN